MFRYRMSVSVVGIKTRLAESSPHSPTFPLTKGGARGKTHHSPPRLRSPHSGRCRHTASGPGHTPRSCTATAQPGTGAGGSALPRTHLHSPHLHHRVPRHHGTEDLLDTGFLGLDMPSFSLKGRSWLGEVEPLYHGLVYLGICGLLMNLIHRKPRTERRGAMGEAATTLYSEVSPQIGFFKSIELIIFLILSSFGKWRRDENSYP